MDTLQIVERVENILRARLWGGSGDPVFHHQSVNVGMLADIEYAGLVQLPAAEVFPGSFRTDPEFGNIATSADEDIHVRIVTQVAGDKFGKGALVGANRSSATSSPGRGLLEIQREVFAALEQLTNKDGVQVKLEAASGAEPSGDQRRIVIARSYLFTAKTSTVPTHQRPRLPAGGTLVTESGGTVTIDWDAPDDVTDLISYVVRRTSGYTPVAYDTDGTAVSWSSGTSTTDTPGAGTWTYSVFAKYADPGGAIALHMSDYVYGTVVVS